MTPAEFQAAFPAFEDEEVSTVQRHITNADSWLDSGRWGGFYAQGLGNLVAHEIVLEAAAKCQTAKEAALASMPVISKTVDQSVTISYSDALLVTASKDPFMRTIYGQRYRYLADLAGIGAVAV